MKYISYVDLYTTSMCTECALVRGYKLSLGKEGDNFQRHHGRDPEIAN